MHSSFRNDVQIFARFSIRLSLAEPLDALVVVVLVDVEHQSARVQVDAVLGLGNLQREPSKIISYILFFTWTRSDLPEFAKRNVNPIVFLV